MHKTASIIIIIIINSSNGSSNRSNSSNRSSSNPVTQGGNVQHVTAAAESQPWNANCSRIKTRTAGGRNNLQWLSSSSRKQISAQQRRASQEGGGGGEDRPLRHTEQPAGARQEVQKHQRQQTGSRKTRQQLLPVWSPPAGGHSAALLLWFVLLA